MKIAYIAAGAVDMYCGSCIHDNTLAAALQKLGEEVLLVPTYTPLRTDEENVSVERVFYGGISVYLRQKSSLFRHSPKIVDSLLSRPGLLSLAARFSSWTNARDLGEMVVSVLQGERGPQRKELEKLIQWLATEQPDLIQLTNSFFLGMAGPLKRHLGVPVVCALQGEDMFLKSLMEPFRNRALRLIAEHAEDADGFISPSNYYADFMADYLSIPRSKIDVVYLGIYLGGYQKPADNEAGSGNENERKIGYLARICPEKGLHLLAKAFIELKRRRLATEISLEVAGYLGNLDKPYLRMVVQQLSEAGLADSVTYHGEVDRQEKLAFLRSLDILSVPTTYIEPKGLFVLEALASGVPVVLPDHGSFPEVLERTGGGILVEPRSPTALADAIETLLQDPSRRRSLGQNGRKAVLRDFNDRVMAEATLKVYQRHVQHAT